MILCVIAIGVVVTVVAVLNTAKDPVDVVNPDPKPPVVKPDDDKDKPVVEKKFALVMPVVGGVEGKAFDDKNLCYNETLNRYEVHLGVDINASVGSNVLAGFEGEVLSVENNTHDGGIVTIDYGKGNIGVFRLLSDLKVKKGDKVTEKTVIGKVGVFGFECKQEPHIHFSLEQNKKTVDPMLYIVGADK